jgi:hypothetical protein
MLIDCKAYYTLNFAKEKEEWDVVTQCTFNRGSWTLEEGKLHVICTEDAELYTGNYYMEDLKLKAIIEPLNGISHNISFRVKGAMMGYHVGFNGENKVSFIKNDHGNIVLAEKEFNWDFNKKYVFEVETVGKHHIFKIDGEEIFNIEDDTFDYGMYGFKLNEIGRAVYESLEVKEL